MSTKTSLCQVVACLLTLGDMWRCGCPNSSDWDRGHRHLDRGRGIQRRRHEESAPSFGRALMGKGYCLFWILGMSWRCARNVPSKYGPYMVISFAFSKRKSRQSTRLQTMRMVGPSPMTKVSTMWRIVLLCATRVKPAFTRFLARRRAGQGGLNVSFCDGRVVPLSGLSESLFLEFSDLWSIRSLLQRNLKSSPILGGLQQQGNGCDGRRATSCELCNEFFWKDCGGIVLIRAASDVKHNATSEVAMFHVTGEVFARLRSHRQDVFN